MIALLLQRCVKNIQWIFLNAHFQSQPSKMLSFSYYTPPPHSPPPAYFRLPTCFLLLLGMPLRHLGGWLRIIQKFPRDILRSSTIVTMKNLPICGKSGNEDEYSMGKVGQVRFKVELSIVFFRCGPSAVFNPTPYMAGQQ